MKTLKAGTIKRIHVNKHVILANLKRGENNPPITIQTSKGPIRARRLVVKGSSETVYSPHKPLKCGARLWQQTKAAVEYE